MDSDTLKNWAKVEKALRDAGKTGCDFKWQARPLKMTRKERPNRD